MADDGIVEYLNDPAGAVRQMQMRLLELVGQNEMGVETILEDVVAMPLERRSAFINWLGSSNDPRAASLLIPLLEHQSGKILIAIIEALEQLGPIVVHQTVPALNRIIATTSNRQIKQFARAAQGRLTMQSMLSAEDSALMEARYQQLPVNEARVSSIDGSGTQLIMLSWQRPDGLVKGINVLYMDQKGIKDCYGIDEMDMEQWKSLVKDLEEQGFNSFTVPFSYGRALVREARLLNKRSRYRLPVAYTIWRPLTESGIPLKKQTNAPTMLEPLPLEPATLALAQRGDELYQMKDFVSWLYEPMERIEPYITRYWATQDVFDAPTQGKHTRKRKLKAQEQRAFLEQLIEEAMADLIDDQWRRRYETRLRRQAMLLQHADRMEDVALLRAVAAVLHPDSPVPIAQQPFPRTLISLSIEQGPLRLMVESLRQGHFENIPLDIFGQGPNA